MHLCRCLGASASPQASQAPLSLQHANSKATERNAFACVQVFGIIGNPVAHSRSPLIHNSAFQEAGLDAVYVPLLVNNLERFLGSPAARSFSGFSVTIPHKV